MGTFTTEQLRNVALLSHSGAGKTSLGEALLLASGAITRLGKVEDGTLTGDNEPEAVKCTSSTQLSVLPCPWKGHQVTLLDTPGYFDFIGDALSALRVAVAAVFVVAAAAGDAVAVAAVAAPRSGLLWACDACGGRPQRPGPVFPGKVGRAVARPRGTPEPGGGCGRGGRRRGRVTRTTLTYLTEEWWRLTDPAAAAAAGRTRPRHRRTAGLAARRDSGRSQPRARSRSERSCRRRRRSGARPRRAAAMLRSSSCATAKAILVAGDRARQMVLQEGRALSRTPACCISLSHMLRIHDVSD